MVELSICLDELFRDSPVLLLKLQDIFHQTFIRNLIFQYSFVTLVDTFIPLVYANHYFSIAQSFNKFFGERVSGSPC